MSRRDLINLVMAVMVSLDTATALSQFQNDASFSIVDNDLSSTAPTTPPAMTMAPTAPTAMTMVPTATAPPAMTMVPTAPPAMTMVPTAPPAMTMVPTAPPAMTMVPTAPPAMTMVPTVPPAMTMVPTTTRSRDIEEYLQLFNPLSGFDDPPPVLLRGDDGLNAASGIFRIVDDGYYVFTIHRVGIDDSDSPLRLTRVPHNDRTMNTTLATLEDTGEDTIFSMHVLAELKRDDRVLISNEEEAEVIGDTDNPFIYNAFLLYQPPITNFPHVRQTAFSVTSMENLTLAEEPITNYDAPVVDIGSDFDRDDGIFLVPMKGIYIFHLYATFILDVPAINLRPAIAITVNRAKRARVQARFGETQNRKNTAVTIAQSLHQNDEVQLLNLASNPTVECNVVFTGYLLS